MIGQAPGFGIVIALVATTIPLVALARRVNISYPIVLVVAGLLLGFIPGLPHVQLDPDIVLLAFLPPLLYWESITAPTDVMRTDTGQIGLLAFGLVIATTLAVGVAAHGLIPDLPWGAAFVLGAIVSPTDVLAAVPVLETFRLPRHLIAIVDGESLLNDATALVVYAAAIEVVTTGFFRPVHALATFAVTLVGSLAIGYIAGRIAVALWRYGRDEQLQSVVSVVLPFIAYYPAQHWGLSGVLAVVTAGVYVNSRSSRVLLPTTRTRLRGFWDTLVFIVNIVLFLLVGLQLHDIATEAFARHSWWQVVGYALAVNVVVVVVRLGLAVAGEYAPVRAPADHAAPDWRHALIVAWSGLRGAVSLAAALAIPLALPSGAPFPDRDLIIFITFSVILVTLVGGGLTLPSVVRALHVEGGTEERDEVRAALVASAQAALARIDELVEQGRIDAAHARKLRGPFEHKLDVHRADEDERVEHFAQHRAIEREILHAQHEAIIAMRERGEIDNVVLRHLQADLDLAASRIALHE